ncbi:activating transcription factor 7-interacting protein 1 [Gastrophryne carolinensis]
METPEEPQKKVFKARKTMKASDRQQLEVLHKAKEDLLKPAEIKLFNGSHENGDSDMNCIHETDSLENKNDLNGIVDINCDRHIKVSLSDLKEDLKSELVNALRLPEGPSLTESVSENVNQGVIGGSASAVGSDPLLEINIPTCQTGAQKLSDEISLNNESSSNEFSKRCPNIPVHGEDPNAEKELLTDQEDGSPVEDIDIQNDCTDSVLDPHSHKAEILNDEPLDEDSIECDTVKMQDNLNEHGQNEEFYRDEIQNIETEEKSVKDQTNECLEESELMSNMDVVETEVSPQTETLDIKSVEQDVGEEVISSSGEGAISSSVEVDQALKSTEQNSSIIKAVCSDQPASDLQPGPGLHGLDSMETDEIIPILEKLAPVEDELQSFSKPDRNSERVADEENIDDIAASPSKNEANTSLPSEAFLVLSDEEELCEVTAPKENALIEDQGTGNVDTIEAPETAEEQQKHQEVVEPDKGKNEISHRKRSKSEDLDSQSSKRRRFEGDEYEAELKVKITAGDDLNKKLQTVIQRLFEEKISALQFADFDRVMADLKTRVEKIECKKHENFLHSIQAKISRLTKRFGAAKEDLKRRPEERALHSLDVVGAMKFYLISTKTFSKSDLFVLPFEPRRGFCLLLYPLSTKTAENSALKVCLFVLASAPGLFKLLAEPLVYELERDWHCGIDDLVLFAPSTERLIQGLKMTMQLLEQLGWVLNYEKSSLVPSQLMQTAVTQSGSPGKPTVIDSTPNQVCSFSATNYRNTGTVRQMLESKRGVGETTTANMQLSTAASSPVSSSSNLLLRTSNAAQIPVTQSSSIATLQTRAPPDWKLIQQKINAQNTQSAQPKPSTPVTSAPVIPSVLTTPSATVVGNTPVSTSSSQPMSVSLQSLPVILHVPVAMSSQSQILQGATGTLVTNQQSGNVEFIPVQNQSTVSNLTKTPVTIPVTKAINAPSMSSPSVQRNSPATSISSTLTVQAAPANHPIAISKPSLPTVGSSGIYNQTGNRNTTQLKPPGFNSSELSSGRTDLQVSRVPAVEPVPSKKTPENNLQVAKSAAGVIDLTLDDEDPEMSSQDSKRTSSAAASTNVQPSLSLGRQSQTLQINNLQSSAPVGLASQATMHVVPTAQTTVNITQRPGTQSATRASAPRAPNAGHMVYSTTTLPNSPAQTLVRNTVMQNQNLRQMTPQTGGAPLRMPQTATYIVNNGMQIGSGPQLTVHHRPPQEAARPVHPAPLPEAPQPQRLPPEASSTSAPQKPHLKLARVQSQNGIVLSWSVLEVDRTCAAVDSYHLYAYHEDPSATSPSQWKKIGEVKALPLPMACTLTQFVSGSKYYFAVRAKDIYGRFGPFCDPQSTDVISTQSS